MSNQKELTAEHLLISLESRRAYNYFFMPTGSPYDDGFTFNSDKLDVRFGSINNTAIELPFKSVLIFYPEKKIPMITSKDYNKDLMTGSSYKLKYLLLSEDESGMVTCQAVSMKQDNDQFYISTPTIKLSIAPDYSEELLPEERLLDFSARFFCHSLKKGLIGSAKGKQRNKNFKCKSTGKKIVRPIVYVKPTSFKSSYYEKNKNNISWSHCWEVMGHWRNIKSLGKNRQGDYTESNRTWVMPYKKGDGKLIKKTRILSASI